MCVYARAGFSLKKEKAILGVYLCPVFFVMSTQLVFLSCTCTCMLKRSWCMHSDDIHVHVCFQVLFIMMCSYTVFQFLCTHIHAYTCTVYIHMYIVAVLNGPCNCFAESTLMSILQGCNLQCTCKPPTQTCCLATSSKYLYLAFRHVHIHVHVPM